MKITICTNHIREVKKVCDQKFHDLTAFTKIPKFIALENLELTRYLRGLQVGKGKGDVDWLVSVDFSALISQH